MHDNHETMLKSRMFPPQLEDRLHIALPELLHPTTHHENHTWNIDPALLYHYLLLLGRATRSLHGPTSTSPLPITATNF